MSSQNLADLFKPNDNKLRKPFENNNQTGVDQRLVKNQIDDLVLIPGPVSVFIPAYTRF